MQTEKINHLGQVIEVLGSDTLVDVVLAALRARTPLSIVRMPHGEEKILTYCKTHKPTDPMLQFGTIWCQKYGVSGIQCGEMRTRLDKAAKECTYFAPDGGEEFFLKHYPYRPPFAEIYFPHRWSRLQRQVILQEAKKVLVINANRDVVKRMQESPYNPGAEFYGVTLNHWTQSEWVLTQILDSCPLVFLSGGPASKYLAPAIAAQGKVVLDMGSGAPHFWCTQRAATCPESKCGAVARIT